MDPGSEIFTCTRYRCTMSRAACLRRQALRVKLYLKGRRASSGTHCAFDLSPCNPTKCEQGRANALAAWARKGTP